MSRASFTFQRVYVPDPEACLRAYALLLGLSITPAARIAPIAHVATVPPAVHSLQQRRRRARARKDAATDGSLP